MFVKDISERLGWVDSVNIRMQSGHGQYGGLPGIQQFVVESCSSPHGLFAALSQEQINHNTNHPLQINQAQAHQAIQQAGFQNQKVLQQQQQQHQLGLQAAESSDAPPRSRDLNSNKAYGSLREAAAGSHVQGREQVPPQTLTDDDGAGEEGERGGGGVNRWPREETLALLRIRSGLDSNFRDSNIKGPLWENVSRKLGELGYFRSAKKCKEKFENISKYYKKTKDGRIGRQDGKSYRFFSELEALYSHSHGGSRSSIANANRTTGQEVTGIEGPEKTSNAATLNLSSDNTSEDDHYNNNCQNPMPSETHEQVNRKKRKRKHLASITAFFESLVKQVMGHQEELHRKFLEAIERREQERLNREEAWKRQEMARLNKETELRAQEHALASTREAAIVAFLQKITGQNLNLPISAAPPLAPTETQQEQEKLADDAVMPDLNSKRWPKPEVQALIRLRSNMDTKFQEPGFKGPLWEEISTGMACLGFHRSAKRCKEKWENINKYFRKTKDNMKKRPQNAKTCPYFDQLNLLYSNNPRSSKMEGHSSDDQADPDHDNNNDNNNNGEDDEHAQIRPSDSELLAAMIHGDQAGGTSLAKNNAATTTVHDHFFQDGHPVDQVQKRFKTKQHLPAGIQASNPLVIISEGGSKLNAFEDTFSGNIKKGATMDSLVKEMLEMQQQKFLDAFDRREHEQEQQQSMSSEERQQRHHHPEETTQDDRSQSALMALVHKLTVNATDYATG